MIDVVKICKKHGELVDRYVDSQGKCCFCRSEYNKNYYVKNVEKHAVRMKTYRKVNKKKVIKTQREYQIKARKELLKAYVVRVLQQTGYDRDLLTDEFIDLKRQIMILQREIKEKRDE